ncbi:peptide/nickel transport system ATP-binding protein/oligopeptide transport system ATP-binding protein [Rhizobiales bacterium GAS191]|nr:peptide/nickel transport system ATP-binding protein/oligopeptide transport system ATP-binding protein [Rhizobiales bacterium GAS113]SEC95703.1 peptide/nickel transport system ATP-binding protein/oligopeptide transport system ATP-binding protein [Rhizobiales bacterium GAS191]
MTDVPANIVALDKTCALDTTCLLEVRDLSKTYVTATGARVRALDHVSFRLAPGEVLGIVGESGCGKSTLGRCLLRLIEPTQGSIVFEGEDLMRLDARAMKRHRRSLQIVFQDPFGSLNPRHRVAAILREPLDVHRIGDGPSRQRRVLELLDLVGLPASAARLYPHEFSGGQRQRVAIARALALAPKLIVADEPVAALDVSIQSQIINLIAELRARLGLSLIFISHDLSVIRHVSDRIAVMYLGRICEIGTAATVLETGAHPYTRALASAAPIPGAKGRRNRIMLQGEPPDPASPPGGCPFHPRCPQAMPRCAQEQPSLLRRRTEQGTAALACHLYETA